MDINNIEIKQISAVSNTALMTLYCRANDYEKELTPYSPRNLYIAKSVLDFSWIQV